METTTLFDMTTEYENITEPFNTTQSQKAQLLLYDFLIPTIGAFSMIMNAAVVVSSGLILKKGQQPRSTYLFLGNVAMTDLVTSFAVVFGAVFPKQYRDHYVCSMQIGMIVSSTLASVYSVGLIATDRFLYIIHGLQYQQWVYPLRARLLILFTWIIGGVIGFLPLMGWAGDTKNGQICWFILLAPKELILLTVCAGILPLLLVVVLYSIILYHAIRKISQLQRATAADAQNRVEVDDKGLRIFRGRGNVSDNSDIDEQPSKEEKSLFKKIFPKKASNPVNNPSKWKAIKVVLFTTGCFLCTWSPYFIVSVMYTFCEDPDEPYCKSLKILIASPLAILGFLNGLINPIIYAWWHKGFRSFVRNKVQSIRRKSKSASSSKNTSSTSGDRKISNISGNVAKMGPVRTTSKSHIMGTSQEVLKENSDDNKSYSKSETSTKLSNVSLNRNSNPVCEAQDGFSFVEGSFKGDSVMHTHL